MSDSQAEEQSEPDSLAFAKIGAAVLAVAMLSVATCTASQSWSDAQVKVATANAAARPAVVQAAPVVQAPAVPAVTDALDAPYVPPAYDINWCTSEWPNNLDYVVDCYHKLLVKVAKGQIRVVEGDGSYAKAGTKP